MAATTSNKAGSAAFRMSEGDWVCEDTECANINFARRTTCNLCGKEKPDGIDGDDKKKLGHEIGKAAAEKSKGLFSADDWSCARCGNVNWARRSTCNMCNASKFGETDERTGLGGGYNEREKVEYKQREEESEDEYDDFGRRKKKVRTFAPVYHHKHRDQQEEEEEEEDDDDDDVDVSKYKLDSDEEEDDEEGDLSKYKLDSSDEDENENDKKGDKPDANSKQSTDERPGQTLKRQHSSSSSNSTSGSASGSSSSSSSDNNKIGRK